MWKMWMPVLERYQCQISLFHLCHRRRSNDHHIGRYFGVIDPKKDRATYCEFLLDVHRLHRWMLERGHEHFDTASSPVREWVGLLGNILSYEEWQRSTSYRYDGITPDDMRLSHLLWFVQHFPLEIAKMVHSDIH